MKKAFSMVELVFAIVLAGLASTAVPMIVSQTSDTNIKSLTNGELLTHARSNIITALDAPWEVTGAYYGIHRVYGKYDTATKKTVCDALTNFQKVLCEKIEQNVEHEAKQIGTYGAKFGSVRPEDISSYNGLNPVSYTHLTLPTICSV